MRDVAAGRFHAGELAVQRRAGVSDEAARLEGMLAPAHLSGGAAGFLAQRRFAVLTGRDHSGRLWTSPLVGEPGFLDARETTLTVHSEPAVGGPLHDLPAGQQVGLIAMEFAIRRRLRVNGTLTARSHGLEIEAREAFGNCPSYIQRRALETATTTAHHHDPETIIRRADTFFLGTVHPERGADVSHRGGRPGFVRVDGSDLWWPDYAGNNMFNSLGNIAVDPEAALLFVDFGTGETLHLSGSASIEWVTPGGPGDDGDTGRRVRFRPDRIVTGPRLPIRAGAVEPSPHNPALR